MNVQINTNDGHEVYYDDKICVNHGNIIIGENVWLTSNSIVCKNPSIADGCILAQGAALTKKITAVPIPKDTKVDIIYQAANGGAHALPLFVI